MQTAAAASTVICNPAAATAGLRSRRSVILLLLPHYHYSTCSLATTTTSSSSVAFVKANRRRRRRSIRAISSSPFPSGADADADADAVAVAVADVGKPPRRADDNISDTIQLGVLMALWILLNIYFNIFNKQVLKVCPFPFIITTFQFGFGTILITLMWATNLHKRPKISPSQLATILPLAVAHMMGNLFTNMSLGKVAVSFTHTVKAMEPFFSVLLSALFLGETPSIWVLTSLVPIVGGVALASLTEASFNWTGFWSAMASNLTNQSRNVFSKKIMVEKEETLDDINLFSIITVMSFLLSVPPMLFAEGSKFTPLFAHEAGLNIREMCVRSLLAGFCFHTYQQVAYMILARISPVTHSVANCVKRVVVIVSSVIFFRTPVSPINSLGTSVAIAGVFVYSRLTRIKPKTK